MAETITYRWKASNKASGSYNNYFIKLPFSDWRGRFKRIKLRAAFQSLKGDNFNNLTVNSVVYMKRQCELRASFGSLTYESSNSTYNHCVLTTAYGGGGSVTYFTAPLSESNVSIIPLPENDYVNIQIWAVTPLISGSNLLVNVMAGNTGEGTDFVDHWVCLEVTGLD